MTLEQIAPAPDERLFVCGQTGTGKTRLIEALIPLMARKTHVVLYDTKGEMFGRGGYPEGLLLTRISQLPSARARVIHLRLPIHDQTDETHDRFYGWIFDRGDTMVVTDEMSMVMDGYQVPDGFRACACQGRSRGVGMINGSQRPASIPVVARSEAQRYCCFELALRDDRKAVGEYMTARVVDEPAHDHWFWYWSKHERKLHYLQLNLQGE